MNRTASIVVAAVLLLAVRQTTGSTVSFKNAPVALGHISKTAFDGPRFIRVQRDVGGRPMLHDSRAADRARELVTAYLDKHK